MNIHHQPIFFWKIFLVLVSLLLVVGLMYVLITANLAEKYFQERNQVLNASIAEHIITEVKPFIDGELTEDATDEIMHHMMAINPSIEVYILDPSGNILNYVAPYKRVKLEKVDLAPVTRFIESKGEDYITGDDPRNPGQTKVFSAAAIQSGESIQGYVYVVLASEEFESAAAMVRESYIFKLGGRAMLITLAVALILGALIIWIITGRLDKLVKTVNKFQQGEMSARIETRGDGAIRDLAVAFNDMADSIVGNIENLKSMEALRRELVGNVSHDLRTPLAVIHGYVETLMIKKKDLSEEDQEKYLDIILASTEKLRNLVNELFELSKLEAAQVSPNKEPFFIEELIHDICRKFEILAHEKRIQLRTETTSRQSLVYADVGMIERVLQNLIDNALKFTPEGGTIRIEVNEENDNVEIKVSDTGKGIPEDQIPYIFDRYHIGDKRISLDKDSTGLGLAIVKKILEIHNSTIRLNSRINRGTSFAFNLPTHTNYA